MFAPINTGFADEQGHPTARLLRFQRDRSSAAVGINYVGNVAVGRNAATNASTVVMADERDVSRVAVVARRISREGSLPGIQIASAPHELEPRRGWRATNVRQEVDRLRSIVRALSDNEIQLSLDAFVKTAGLSVRAGFSVIQIHAAHGYLLSLLLHPDINGRHGRYAADEIWYPKFITRVATACEGRVLSVRLSGFLGISEDETSSFLEQAAATARAGADIIDISAGAYTVDRRLIYPNWGDGPLPYLDLAKQLLAVTPSLVATAGNVATAADIPSELPERLMVEVGRALIADPLFALRLRDGQIATINPCRRTSHCHYFSRGRQHLECGSNPSI